MKQILTLLLLFTISFGFSQNDNPYAEFGYKGNTIKTPQERMDYMLIIPNQDALSIVKKIGIEPKEGKYYLFDKDNNIILQDTLTKQQITRFFAIDPLSKDYPHNAPYAFSENQIINAVELEGLEKAEAIFGGAIKIGMNSKGKLSILTSGIVSLGVTGIPGFQPEITANINLYSGGLGSAGNSSSFNIDGGISAYATVGFGHTVFSTTTLYNQSTSSLIPNDFAVSATYGTSFAYNSAANRTNQYGIVGLKVGYIGLSYANDQDGFGIAGSGKDREWSGGVGLSAFGNDWEFKLGYDNFTGKGSYKGLEAPQSLKKYSTITNTEGNVFYSQTSYERSLNKSSLYGQLRIGKSIYGVEYDCGGCLQNYIHTGKLTPKVDNPKFEFDQKGTTSGSVQQNF